MSHRRQPDTRARVLRWLLAVLTVAGMGVLAAGHCVGDVPAAGTTYAAAQGSEWHGPSDADACHLQPAPRVAASATVAADVQPPAGFRALPVAAPSTMRTPRQPGAVALTDIGISRT